MLLVAGCHGSASIGSDPSDLTGSAGTPPPSHTGPTISQNAVEHKVSVALSAKVHRPNPTVVCPGDLDATVGATITCELTPRGSTEPQAVRVTVATVRPNGAYHLGIRVEAPSDPSSP